MPLPVFAALIATTVPPISLGPDDIAQAPIAALAMTRVIVFPGRARVERAGTVQLDSGPRVVRLPLLPGGVDPTSIRVEASGARVLRVTSRVVEDTVSSLDRAEGLVAGLEAQSRARRQLETRRTVVTHHLARLKAVGPSPAPSPGDRDGPVLATPTAQWRSALEVLASALAAALEEKRELDEEIRVLDTDRAQRVSKLARLEATGFVTRGREVGVVLLVPKAGSIRLAARYALDGPEWRPRYRLKHQPQRGEVQVELRAEVRQSTGEDWRNAQLVFSTAIPGRDLTIPSLPAWILGEEEDLVLVPRPATGRPVPGPRPAWPELGETRATAARVARLLRYRERRRAFGAPSSTVDLDIARRAPPPPEAPVRMPRPEPSREDLQMEEAVVEFDDVQVTGVLSSKVAGPKYRSTALSLFETAAPPLRWPPGLPQETQGADVRYSAQGAVPVPSGDVGVEVPLARFEVPVAPFHRATPSLDDVGFLRAEVENPSPRPWLSGPGTLYSGNEVLGEIRLVTTGPGGVLALPLGRDERIQVARRVESRAESTGFLGGRRKERFEVTIDVVSHLEVATRIEVLEPVPVAKGKDLQVTLESVDPSPVPLPEKEVKDGLPRRGVLRWEVPLAPKEKRSLSLVYAIEYGAGERAYQE